MWRDDGKCGFYYLLILPDRTGTVGQCNPDGDKPCCSSGWYGECGNTAEHCSCSSCVNYTRILRDLQESGGTQKWRYDGMCGKYYPLPDGTPGQCDPDGDKPCCDRVGNCGNTADHCSCRECTDYKFLKQWEESNGTVKWTSDGKCGGYYRLPDGTPGQCDPDGDKPCCSSSGDGRCIKAEHCSCWDCTDYKFLKQWEESSGTVKWTFDGNCGKYYPLPDGTPGQCDPDGDKPCCNSGRYGMCGDTTVHCSCSTCTNYTRIYSEWEESGGSKKWRYDRKCGSYYPLPDGTPAQCDPDGGRPCCSHVEHGLCGNTENHCSCSGCVDYKFLKQWEESGGTQKWRYDGRCGSDYPLPDGTPGQCDPDGDKPCCSSSGDGSCGKTERHCSCSVCTNYTRIYREWEESGGTQKWRYDGKCGSSYPLPDGKPTQCDPDGDKPCCGHVEHGLCGNTENHCSCSGCVDYKFLKQWEESGGTQKWRYDGRCGSDYPLPDGTPGQCDPDGDKPCCSSSGDGRCIKAEHCSCWDCTDYKFLKQWEDSEGKLKWTFDGKCGKHYHLPDGTPAQCNPDGDKPCCSSYAYGSCGKTERHCSCSVCTNYTRIYREWEESGGTQKWRYDGKCGRYYPLPDGKPTQCDPDGDKPCCGHVKHGLCGNTENHCSCRYCVDYKFLKQWVESGGTQKWRYDGRCGSDYPLPDGTLGQCDPDGDKPCCSSSGDGRCIKAEHCSCWDCTDYKFLKQWEDSGGTLKCRYDGKCGSRYPLPDGTLGQCDPDGEKPCCSAEGECGSTAEHCSCSFCTDYKFAKWWRESGGTQMWRNDSMCGRYYPLPDDTLAQCDPDGDNPCCDNYGKCGSDRTYCLCRDCVDYRVVREIKKIREKLHRR